MLRTDSDREESEREGVWNGRCGRAWFVEMEAEIDAEAAEEGIPLVTGEDLAHALAAINVVCTLYSVRLWTMLFN